MRGNEIGDGGGGIVPMVTMIILIIFREKTKESKRAPVAQRALKTEHWQMLAPKTYKQHINQGHSCARLSCGGGCCCCCSFHSVCR